MRLNLTFIGMVILATSSNTFASPIECQYLNTQGIYTGEYYNEEDAEARAAKRMGIPYEKDINAEYVCLSDYVEIGKSKKNNIAYYAYGKNPEKVKRVVLTLGVTDKSDEEATLNEYAKYTAILFKKYTGTDISNQYLSKIKNRQSFNQKVGNYTFSLTKNGNNNRYGLSTEIKKLK